MKDEVKEILQKIKNVANRETASRNALMEMQDKDYQLLLDYITNLQEELENLREDNWAYHQLLRTQNKREYRSKFLKDFQREHGTNTFPDYDEIYKRYDDYKSRCENAIEFIEGTGYGTDFSMNEDEVDSVLNILQGSEPNETK